MKLDEGQVYQTTLIPGPISRLPTEVLCIIFYFLPPFEVLDLESSPSTSITSASPVCRRWRDIFLSRPLLWNYINFTKLTRAGATVMLARAKTSPLYLEAQTTQWGIAKVMAFKEQIEAHIHHTRHLSITARLLHLRRFGRQLVSSAPSLEMLSIHGYH